MTANHSTHWPVLMLRAHGAAQHMAAVKAPTALEVTIARDLDVTEYIQMGTDGPHNSLQRAYRWGADAPRLT